ncbi:hypothetical protein D3C71_2077790 [compost metagenome]
MAAITLVVFRGHLDVDHPGDCRGAGDVQSACAVKRIEMDEQARSRSLAIVTFDGESATVPTPACYHGTRIV